jgi:hypothetical protein
MAVFGYAASDWRTFNIGGRLQIRKWNRLTGGNTGASNHGYNTMYGRYYWNDIGSAIVILDPGHPESYDTPSADDNNGSDYGGTIISTGDYGRCGWGGIYPPYYQNDRAGYFYCGDWNQWGGCNYGNNYTATQVFWTYCFTSMSWTGGRYAGVYGQRYHVWPNNLGYSYSSCGVACATNGVRSYEHGPDYMPVFADWNSGFYGWHMVTHRLNGGYHQLFVDYYLVSNGGYGYQGIPQMSSAYLVGGVYGYHYGYFSSYTMYPYYLQDYQINQLFQWTRARYGV